MTTDNQPNNDNHKPQERIRLAIHGHNARFVWTPQPDITASELAEALVLLQLGPGVALGAIPPQAINVAYNQLPDDAKRHFVVQQSSGIILPGG